MVIDQPSAPGGQQTQIQIPFNPQPGPPLDHQAQHHPGSTGPVGSSTAPYPAQGMGGQPQVQVTDHSQQQQQQQQSQNIPQQNPYPVPFDPDDMELEMEMQSQPYSQSQPSSSRSSPSSHGSSGTSTPLDSPISTPLTAYPSPTAYADQKGLLPLQMQQMAQLQIGQQPHSPYSGSPYNSPYTSQPPSPHSNHSMAAGAPVAAFETTTLLRRAASNSGQSTSSLSGATTLVSPTAQPGASTSRPNLNLNLTSFSRPSSAGQHHNTSHIEPFNPYARYAADYSVGMPGTNPLDLGDSGGMGIDAGGAVSPYHTLHQGHAGANGLNGMSRSTSSSSLAGAVEGCVPPALLFSNAGTPESTPSTSRVPSPTQLTYPAAERGNGGRSPTLTATSGGRTTNNSAAAGATSNLGGGSGSSTPAIGGAMSATSASARLSQALSGRPGATGLLLSKPFKCPKPNCNKSYKQANGELFTNFSTPYIFSLQFEQC